MPEELQPLYGGTFDFTDTEVALGVLNVATTAEACRLLVIRAAQAIAERKGGLYVEAARDLAKAVVMLKALVDRAATGKIVDLETLGVWESLMKEERVPGS
jgi:hypothetical protein